MDIKIPLDVPSSREGTYVRNMRLITKDTGKLFLFAGDQRVEHLNNDFYGDNISAEDNDPEHMFKIASKAKIGCFSSQMGYIAKYGRDYNNFPYIVKINSKTNLLHTSTKDPVSRAWYDVDQIVEFMGLTGLKIAGIGYTIYLGSEFENDMLREAAQLIHKAHSYGLIVILWMYPRGKSIIHEKDPHLIAGACNVGTALGADFVKVNFPESVGEDPALAFKEATKAAGRTGVICAGGNKDSPEDFIKLTYTQLHISETSGAATGRNVHQRPLKEAIALCNAISALVYENKTAEEAIKIANDQTSSH